MSLCSPPPPNVDWINARIAAIQAQIVALEEAYTGLLAGTMASYSLSTGQTVQQVTKLNISTLKNQMDWLEERLQYYQDQLTTGSRVFNYRPGW